MPAIVAIASSFKSFLITANRKTATISNRATSKIGFSTKNSIIPITIAS